VAALLEARAKVEIESTALCQPSAVEPLSLT
jgi:hypothetical protein